MYISAGKVMAMSEYINKFSAVDKLIRLENEFQQYKPFSPKESAMYQRICEIEIEIGKMQSADVAPVMTGQWEWFEEWDTGTSDHPRECEDCGWRCSRCKTALEDVVGGYWDNPDEVPKVKFCPNCGVQMEGKHNNE